MAKDKKKIMVVDDEEDQLDFYSMVLEDSGYEVITAKNGKEALDAARREKPDLVVLDLMMPNQTGTDFYRKLSREKELKDTPIIVVSALSYRYLAVKRAAAVFDKPVDREKFLEAVGKALA
ncbi:MAG: response regulator [Pseudomonadota bacterium]